MIILLMVSVTINILLTVLVIKQHDEINQKRADIHWLRVSRNEYIRLLTTSGRGQKQEQK